MKKIALYSILGLFLVAGVSACKAKHCAAREEGMDGYSAKKNKKKRGRQEGLWSK